MIQFPINPTLNQEYFFNQRSWIWDGVSWNLKPFQETDPIFNASQAKNITSTHITVLNNTSGINTGDQDLSGLVEKKANHSLVPDTEIDKLSEYPELLEETTNKVVSDTGELVSIPTPSGGYANNLYLGETDSDVAGYKILTYIADTAETIKTVTANSSAGVVTAQTFLYPTGVSVSNFPSGLWSLKLWGNISASAGVSQVGFTYFKRSIAGVETDLFTLWGEEVNSTSDIWIDVIGTQPSYSVDPTDRMGLRLLFKTTSGTNKTLTYYIGDGYAAFVNNPNQIRHSQTRDKNGEVAFQHIDTTTTKPTLDAADMVAIKDSVTGKMVLTPKSNFPTVDAVNLGLATKADKTVAITAGAGLTGGGTLESNRTLNVVSANDGITVNADNIQLNVVDGLANTSATQPLSAKQGKALNDGKVDKVAGKSLILDTEIARLATVTNQTKQTLGIENVDNTSDAAKPISTATQTALNGKVNTTDIEQVRSQATNKVASSKLLDDELKALENAVTVDILSNTADIRLLENVINSANINQETTATVTGVDTIALPKTAANTGMRVQLFGQSAQNLVVNGDFRNGTTGWTAVRGTILTGNNICTLTVETASPTSRIQLNGAIPNFIANNKYYAKFYAMPPVSTSDCRIYIGDAFTSPTVTAQPDIWNLVSGIVAPTSNIELGFYIPTTSLAIGAQVKYKSVQLINLTALGLDSLTKEQCDLLFANYFEGSDNVLGTGRVRSVGKNILNLNTRTKKIYTGQADGMTTAQRLVYYDIIMPITRTGLQSGSVTNYSIDLNFVKITSNVPNYGIGIKIKAKENDTFNFSATTTNGYSGVGTFTSAGVNLTNSVTGTITCPANTDFILFVFTPSSANVEATFINPQLSKGLVINSYEPYRESILQLTTPELRSNGLIKDEIRKGTNGYELVKRVGVGTLGANGITGGDFEGGLIGAKSDGGGSVSTWTLNTVNPISGTQDGRLVLTTVGTAFNNPYIQFFTTRTTGQFRKLSFSYKVNSGTAILSGYNKGGSRADIYKTLSGSGTFNIYYICNGNIAGLLIYFDGRNLFDLQIDNVKDELVNTADGATTSESVTVLGSNIHYTLATPAITPIPHAGLLNSNSNGTVYFEPIIADAGVYGSNLSVQLTDYPIASFESIRKYANGTYTELNTATAIIASGGLSFTHPDLVSGDLVMFTYAYSKESIGRSMTLTHYDNRYVKVDTANGKTYRIDFVVTNGVVVPTATEV